MSKQLSSTVILKNTYLAKLLLVWSSYQTSPYPKDSPIDDFVLQLNKPLYGLKQASNIWATAFKHKML
jgi:hypothetical protein